MSGVNLKAVQTLMGHKTLTMTLRHAHLDPDHLTAAVAALASGDWATQRATEVKSSERKRTEKAVTETK
jgi:site-specific recombinase XerC